VPNEVEDAIVVRGLRKKFGDFVAVDGIDLTIKRGEIFGFIGPNGSGKSTTIKMLLGLLRPTGGTGTVLGFDIKTESERIRQSVGYMAQKFGLYNDLTAGENIRFYASVYGLQTAKAEARIRDTLGLLDIEHIEQLRTKSLSTGWRQRLALACALVHSPQLLILDEPTGGVDPVARREFWHLLYGLAHTGVTVFVTTHYMDEADYCHHLSLINEGRIAADGSPSEIKARSGATNLEDIFSQVVMTGEVRV
jgi:ABC-2 type transport system ATP-binding protein